MDLRLFALVSDQSSKEVRSVNSRRPVQIDSTRTPVFRIQSILDHILNIRQNKLGLNLALKRDASQRASLKRFKTY